MDSTEFLKIIDNPESPTLDFKATQYDLGGKGNSPSQKNAKRANFAKDILAMSNTPRDGAAYIIVGIKKEKYTGEKKLLGISNNYDDGDIQEILANWITPMPSVLYEPIPYQGKLYGIFSVSPNHNGPFFPLKDYNEVLKRQTLYGRRGSQNAEIAIFSPEHNAICSWFANIHISIPSICNDDWNVFCNLVDNFDATNSYILILPPQIIMESVPCCDSLGVIPWDFIIDFNQDNDDKTILSQVQSSIEKRRALHIATLRDSPFSIGDNTTYWYWAAGTQKRQDTLCKLNFLEWNRRYSKDLQNRIETFALSRSKPIIVIALWYNDNYIKFLDACFSRIQSVSPLETKFIIVSSNRDKFNDFESNYEANTVDIPFFQFVEGVKNSKGFTSLEKITIPGSSKALIEIPPHRYASLSEYFEIIHCRLGDKVTDKNILDFQHGASINWDALAIHADIERDQQELVTNKIQIAITDKNASVIKIQHFPGAGGSTFAQRVVWDLHKRYPCLIMKKDIPAQEAIEKIQYIHELTSSPILILAELNIVSEDTIWDIKNLCLSRQIYVIFIVVERSIVKKIGKNDVYLPDTLTDSESDKLKYLLCSKVPLRKKIIEQQICTAPNYLRNIFYFCLIAYEKDFITIEKYVESRLSVLPNELKNILLLSSIIHYYTQLNTNIIFFKNTLGFVNIKTSITDIFNDYTMKILVQTTNQAFRPVHFLISKEIIRQCLTDEWENNLCDQIIALIDDIAESPLKDSDETHDILEHLLILRSTTSGNICDEKFSQLISDIPNDVGRLRIFKKLVEAYSTEPHFWAHLARFYAENMKNFISANDAIDNALNLNKNDPLLYHIQGMDNVPNFVTG